jgi:hypothetical protein
MDYGTMQWHNPYLRPNYFDRYKEAIELQSAISRPVVLCYKNGKWWNFSDCTTNVVVFVESYILVIPVRVRFWVLLSPSCISYIYPYTLWWIITQYINPSIFCFIIFTRTKEISTYMWQTRRTSSGDCIDDSVHRDKGAHRNYHLKIFFQYLSSICSSWPNFIIYVVFLIFLQFL